MKSTRHTYNKIRTLLTFQKFEWGIYLFTNYCTYLGHKETLAGVAQKLSRPNQNKTTDWLIRS